MLMIYSAEWLTGILLGLAGIQTTGAGRYWKIGPGVRSRGSIHSDILTGTSTVAAKTGIATPLVIPMRQ